jgi:hypothetical protein
MSFKNAAKRLWGLEGTGSTARKSDFSQKGEFADVLRWERFTDLKVRVGDAVLNFLTQSGYGLDVEAMKRYRNSLNRCKKFMGPLLIREDDAKSISGKGAKRDR